MTTYPVGPTSAGRTPPIPTEPVVLYQSARTRVLQVPGGDGRAAAVRKEAFGVGSIARTQHEVSILRRLAGVAGVIQPLAETAAEPHTIVFADTGSRSLAQLLTGASFEPAQLLALALRLSEIVAAVHGAGVVHRDVNPFNILFGGNPRDSDGLLLIDFDLATTFAEFRPGFTHHREIIGRLPYLAPEQTGRTGLPVDGRSDLYGVGATLYELATGQPPFGSGDPLQLVRDILARVPKTLAEVVPGVAPGLSDIVSRLLEKEPDRRYQSAAGLAHDLALVCANSTSSPRLGEHDFPSRLSPPSALVGRDGEIATLSSALDGALRTRSRGVLVAGAPGVGKSALIGQLRTMVTELGGWYVTGKFDQYRHDAASGAVAQALAGLGRLLLAEPEEELTVQRERISAALGANAGLITTVASEFATLLGMEHEVGPSDPRDADARLRQASLDMLRAVASPDRPLVLVLDDLQWASQDAISLIDAVQTDEEIRGLLLVGAYRDQEVDATHPLTAILSRWERRGMAPPLLKLENLAATDLAALLREMLRLPTSQATALARAVGQRTEGNPYDTVELVNALRRDGALTLGPVGWTWDESAIRHYIGQGDVLDLIKDRIERLPTLARELVEIMSCLGGEVGVGLLAVAADRTRPSVQEILTAALEDALLVVDAVDPTGRTSTVRFRHDRVQQAARDGLVPAARPRLHLTIARRLAAVTAFRAEAAEQYLAAVDLLTEAAEQRAAAALFEEAAAGARRVSNHAAAARYLRAAAALWQALGSAPTNPALVGLETSLHAALYNLGHLEDADLVYQSIERRCADPLDLVDAACLQIASITNRNRASAAVAFGFDLLGQIGFTVPGNDMRVMAERRLGGVQAWIDRASVAEDVRRPEVTNPRALAGARLIRRMAPAALFSDQTTLLWLFTEAQQLWKEYGPCDALIPTIGMAGFSLIWLTKDYDVAVRIQRHCLAVGEARGYEIETGQARYLYACTAGHWFEALEEDVRHVRIAREILLRGGDLQSACFAYNPSVQALLDCGSTLDDLNNEVEAALEFCARTGNHTTAANILVYRQFCRAMRGETSAPGSFTDDSFDEDEHLRMNPRAGAYSQINRALAAAIFGDAEGLARHAAEVMRSAQLLTGLYPSAIARLVCALALAHQIRQAPPHERPDLAAELNNCRDWLEQRAHDAPENFRHLLLLADAERQWAAGDFQGAVVAFDTAIREVEPRRRPWHQALITERAALFHLAHDMEVSGRRLLVDAHHHYDRWGAVGKVHELEANYPFLRRTGAAHGSSQSSFDYASSTSMRSDDIDMMAILRVSLALSSETDLDRLRTSVVGQTQSITGATSVHLLLFDQDTENWIVPGGGPDQQVGVSVVEAAAQGLLPIAAFRYVERTRQPLLVENACRDDRFARDPYFVGVDRCSLLVVPILNQGAMRAMLFMENRLSRGAFSMDRLDAVILIAGQLAVSLDNALLYRQLEERVAERTRALQFANARLEALSLTDPLTGLGNRRRFDVTLDACWRTAVDSATTIAIAMIDIDHFKWYNDDYGHPAGDACLRRVAEVLAESIRQQGDLVCRYGGEEFVMLLPGADQVSATVVAERARQTVAALNRHHARTEAGHVTVSIGLAAAVPRPNSSPETLIKAADTALYEAKLNGRNRVATAGPSI